MKINYRKFEALKRAANEAVGGYNSNVSIYPINDLDVMMGNTGEAIKFGVNWSAIGTVVVDDAKAFVIEMNNAVRVADMLNKLNITEVSFEEDEALATVEARKMFYNGLVTVLKMNIFFVLEEMFS